MTKNNVIMVVKNTTKCLDLYGGDLIRFQGRLRYIADIDITRSDLITHQLFKVRTLVWMDFIYALIVT